jgi:hypothetical protein
MQCVVVSRLPTVFPLLMLLDYQIGLDFASGAGSVNVDKMNIESPFGPRLLRF